MCDLGRQHERCRTLESDGVLAVTNRGDFDDVNWQVDEFESPSRKDGDARFLAQPTCQERVRQFAVPLMTTDEHVVDQCVASAEGIVDRAQLCHRGLGRRQGE